MEEDLQPKVSTILHRLHFMKMEGISSTSENDSIKYSIRNHFDTKVLDVQGRFGENENSIEFTVTKSQDSKSSLTGTNSLFRISIDKPKRVSETCFTCCKLTSTTTAEPICSISMKDIGLSTQSFDILDNNSTPLFRISRSQLYGSKTEFHVKTMSGSTVARADVHNNKVFLSMAPELDVLTKTKFISFMLLLDIVENHENEADDSQTAVNAVDTTKPSYITHALIV